MGTYLSAIDLVTQNQLTIVARYGVDTVDRMLGDVSPGQATITVNNSSITARQVGALVATEFNVTKSLNLSDNMGGGQRFSTGPALNFYSNPSSGYTNFNQQVGSSFGTISLTSTNFSSQLFDTPGTYSWTVPAGVTSISVAGIGGGGGGSQKSGGGSGGGGGLISYSNSIAVTPGTTCTIFVGSGGATGGTYGNNGSSTYLLLPGTNVPILIAQGGAGGDSIFWTSSSISASYTDITGTITTQAAYDPAGGAITYSVGSGSLPTGASLNTSTGVISWVRQSIASDTEYTPFTLSASNGSQTITKSFTLKILKLTLIFDYLLVGGGGGGGYDVGGGGGGGGVIVGTSYIFVTSSTAITITIGSGGTSAQSNVQGNNGSATTAAFSGSTGTSVYSGIFNGTSQFLTTPATAAYNLYQVSFTIEAWIYCTSFTNTPSIWALGTNGVATYTNFGINTNGSIYFQVNSGTWAWGPNYSTPASSLSLNAWTHVAAVRDYAGGTFKMFINGQQQYTTTSYTEANGSAGTAFIGTYYNSSSFFPGRISNFRLVKGVAVYTAQFAVPSSNLSATQSSGSNIAAISGVQTSLLTLQNSTFIDNSTNGVTITNNGSITTTATTIPILVSAQGGGGGGSYTGANNSLTLGLAGGSGGGGSDQYGSAGGSSTQVSYPSVNGVGYGYAGGTSYSGQWGGGGGGGGGGVGANATSAGGAGGSPYTSSINGSSVNYAGGGFGNTDTGGNYATGNNSSNVTQGYYGYGANGGGLPNASSYSGNPGIAIIRYQAATQLGSGGTTSTSGGYTIHTFTSSGILTF